MMNAFVGTPSSVQQPLSIEQLLRAAKLIEQQAIEKLMVSQPLESLLGHVQQPTSGFAAFPTTKLGENYQERVLASKMRYSAFSDSNNAFGLSSNSTGSSRRSSPISAASTAPNSPVGHAMMNNINIINNNINNSSPPMLLPTTSSSIAAPPSMNAISPARASSSASSTPSCGGEPSRSGRGTSSRQSRAAHNELEKNRRANLRGHLEALKAVLPPESDSHRDTTLSLLTRARNYIRFIKEQKQQSAEKRAALLAEHLRLRELLQLQQSSAAANPLLVSVSAEPQQPKALFCAPAGSPPANSPSPCSAISRQFSQPPAIHSPAEQQQQHYFCCSTSSEADDLLSCSPAGRPDLHFLALNGLLPALPMLYPYSSAVAAQRANAVVSPGLALSPAGFC